MIVLSPLKVTIVNAEGCEAIESAPPIGAPYNATFGKTVYIERSDFREVRGVMMLTRCDAMLRSHRSFRPVQVPQRSVGGVLEAW
jgi:hypothetical protein